MSVKRTIDKWSPGYFLLKYIWVKNVFNLFYRRIEVRNSKVIDPSRPVIIAPNHQNALMDALAVVTQLPYQTVFLTRADIFSKPAVRKMLMWLKMLPIYRLRDGKESLGLNEEIFGETTRILKSHHNPLGIFPEGNHGDKRRLRPLVKGIFRIAFKAQEEYKGNAGVVIIPVGIDYSHYQKIRQTLYINLGNPIEVSEYWKQYEENQATGINSLRNRLIEEMRKCMIDIHTEEYYYTYMGLRGFFRPEMYKRLGLIKRSLSNNFDADKKLIAALDKKLAEDPELIKNINTKFRKYALLRDKLNLRDWVFRKEKYPIVLNFLSLLVCFILSPLFFLGLFNNWPHYFLPVSISRKIRDSQFKSTAAWGSGVAIQAVYYLILSVLAIIFIPYWWVAAIYIITLPASGLAALGIRKMYVKTMARLRYTFNRKASADVKDALGLKTEIMEMLEKVI